MWYTNARAHTHTCCISAKTYPIRRSGATLGDGGTNSPGGMGDESLRVAL